MKDTLHKSPVHGCRHFGLGLILHADKQANVPCLKGAVCVLFDDYQDHKHVRREGGMSRPNPDELLLRSSTSCFHRLEGRPPGTVGAMFRLVSRARRHGVIDNVQFSDLASIVDLQHIHALKVRRLS
jgi:hypothetical protein